MLYEDWGSLHKEEAQEALLFPNLDFQPSYRGCIFKEEFSISDFADAG